MGKIHITDDKLMYDSKEIQFYGDKRDNPRKLRKTTFELIAYAILMYSLIIGFIVVDGEIIDVTPDMFDDEEDIKDATEQNEDALLEGCTDIIAPDQSFRILFLDDDRSRVKTFLDNYPDAVCVYTAEECIEQLQHQWNTVYLDHDLSGECFVDSARNDTGMEVVRYITSNSLIHLRDTEFIIHSLNMKAADLMVNELTQAGYRCSYTPFCWLF